MDAAFLKIVNMSIAASWLILAVILLRVVLKKAPKWINVLLWALVAVRLLCPISFESSLSLVPNAEPIPQEIFMMEPPENHESAVFDPIENPNLPSVPSVSVDTSIETIQWKAVFATFGWMFGMTAMLVYAAISYILVKRKVKASLYLRDNIWICDDIQTPFILGAIKPRIYIPSGTDEVQLPHIIAHENAHLKRRDHWWKPLGFLVLAIHWFNPLVWVAYILLCRDIELACDEKVIRDLNKSESISYSEALLSCSINRRTIMVCPLAFGEVGVKERVKRVLNYKKPAFWIIIVAVIACIVLSVCFLTNPATSVDAQIAVFVDCEIASHHQSEHSGDNFCCLDWEVLGKDTKGNQTTLYMWVLYEEFSYDDELTVETGSHIPTVITVEERDGSYHLVEYWEPRDGSYYAEDIKSKFPSNLWGKALDSQRYIDSQSAALEQLAQEHFSDKYYLYIGEEGVMQIDFTAPNRSGGCVNADGSAFRKGEKVYLEGLDDVDDLSGVTITAYNADGEVVFALSVPEDNGQSPINAIAGEGWMLMRGGREITTLKNEAPTLSLNDVIMLSQKGMDLTWSDFEEFAYIETGSGLYIRVYEINELFELWIGGGDTDEQPMYISLKVNNEAEDSIDIRTENVTDFISAHREDEPTSSVSHTGGADGPSEVTIEPEMPDEFIGSVLPAEWPDNSYTEDVPKPDGGAVSRAWLVGEAGSEEELCNIVIEDMTEPEFTDWLGKIEAAGYSKIASATEPIENEGYTSHNYLYSKEEKGISVSFVDGVFNLVISKNGN